MKLVLDEKLKHRLIGLAVIISLAAIFAPAVMRKSSQRLEHNFSVNIKLPPKPAAPNVAMTDEKDVFKTIKVARVELPAVPIENHLPELAKAQSIQFERDNNETVQIAEIKPETKPIQLAFNDTSKTLVIKSDLNHTSLKQKAVSKSNNVRKALMPVKMNAKHGVKKGVYSVQLASLSRLSNAQSLVNRLKAKGYKANLIKVSNHKGVVYKVYAGQSPRKDEALRLKSQLASAMQINGFVVNTGVS